jgi:hypothetical protein
MGLDRALVASATYAKAIASLQEEADLSVAVPGAGLPDAASARGTLAKGVCASRTVATVTSPGYTCAFKVGEQRRVVAE